jgi:hypothetical protein
MGRLILRLIDWLPRRRWRVVAWVDAADEVPTRLPRRGAVIAGPESEPHWLVFDCPCRRGHRVMLNLDPRRRPIWRITQTQPLTVRPSVDDHTSERRCHFFVREGRINWVPRRVEAR